MASDAIKTIVRWQGNAKIVRFEDTRLAGSVERLQAEEPARLAWVNLDAPPGTYEVESRTTMPGGCWEVRLDPHSGAHVGFHNCPYRAERPRENYPCIHIAAAYLCWRAQRDAQDPFLQKVHAQQERLEMAEQSTALAPYQAPAAMTTYHVPTRQEISDTLALGKVLMETRGAAIPNALDTPQKAAAVILAGRELGFDPMASFRHFFVVDGQTQPDGQALVALMQRGGADIIYHCDCAECADVELIRPGRTPIRVKYTLEQARKAGSTGGTRKDGSKWTKPAWANHPADMLIWKAVARLARRGAADLVNAVQSAMVRVDDFTDATVRLVPEEEPAEAVYERPALPDGGTTVDADTGEILDDLPSDWPEDEAESAVSENPPHAPVDEPWRALTYAEAHADKAVHFQALTAYQKALGRRLRPDGYEAMTLGEIVDGALVRDDASH